MARLRRLTYSRHLGVPLRHDAGPPQPRAHTQRSHDDRECDYSPHVFPNQPELRGTLCIAATSVARGR